jgi:hypothetical protein
MEAGLYAGAWGRGKVRNEVRREGACAPRESKRRRKVAGMGLVAPLCVAYCSSAAGKFLRIGGFGLAKAYVGWPYSGIFRLLVGRRGFQSQVRCRGFDDGRFWGCEVSAGSLGGGGGGKKS